MVSTAPVLAFLLPSRHSSRHSIAAKTKVPDDDKLVELHMGEWFLWSLDFFNCSVENLKLVKREKLVITRSNYEALLFTNFCPTLACTTPTGIAVGWGTTM
jgi:hypothetical protein